MGRAKEPTKLLSEEHKHLIVLLQKLGTQTGKNTQSAQAEALGISTSTWGNWLNGTLPMPSNFDEMLQRANLRESERTAYQKAWQAAQDHPPIPLPRLAQDATPAPTSQGQPAVELSADLANGRSGEGIEIAPTGEMPTGAGQDWNPAGQQPGPGARGEGGEQDEGPSDAQAAEAPPATLEEGVDANRIQTAPDADRRSGWGLSRRLTIIGGGIVVLALILLLADPLGLRSPANPSQLSASGT